MLRILLLGTPFISLDDAPYKITRRLQRALLFFLAARGGPVGREELVGLFWPEENDRDAHRHLREALAKLRAELPGREALIVNPHQVSLDFKQVYVDVLEFKALLGEIGVIPWQIPPHRPLPEGMAQVLINAIHLWRSPHFMAGSDLPSTFGMDDWYGLTRQELEQQRQRLVRRLADHAFARGDLESALSWLLMALQNEETNEELNGRILSLLIDLGRRTAAVNFYNHLKELYEQDENSPVPQALETIYSRIQSQNEETARRNLPGWPATKRFYVPLVGRNAILTKLRQVYNRGGVAYIHGEAGAGKTHLIQELFYSFEPTPRLLLASAHPMEDSLPFQAVIEMLRRYLTPADWHNLSQTWGRQLVSLLPELQVICPEFEVSIPLPPEEARPLLFEAVHQVLNLAASKQRLFIFLDDAQWADEASLATLAYLLERGFFKQNGFLAIAARLDEPNPKLEATLNIARQLAQYHEVSLPLLLKPEINELVSYVLRHAPPAALIDKLAKDTGGNPLLILFSVYTLLEMKVNPLDFQATDVLPLASNIHALLRIRMQGVHPQARQTALTAAVIGNTFEAQVLEQAAQISEDSLAQALDELERLQLVRVVGDPGSGPVTYAFIHDKIREVLLLELSPARERLLHRRVARALEASLGGRAAEQAAVLAQHYESAGNQKIAFDWWLKAAQHARQLFSISEAEASFKKAELILQNQTSELSDEQVYQLYSRWGEMVYETHGQESLARVYTSLLDLGKQRQSPLLIGSGLSGLCVAAVMANEVDTGLDYADQAMPYLLRAGNSFELVQLYTRLGWGLNAASHYKEAIAAYEKAIEINANSQQGDGQQAQANAQHRIAWNLYMTGWPEQAIKYIENAVRESRFLLQPYTQMRFYSSIILAYVYAGNYAAAQEYTQKGLELAERLQNWRGMSLIKVDASRSELALGHLDTSYGYALEALELGQHHHIARVIAGAYGTLGDTFQLLGDTPRAREAYQKGLAGAQSRFSSLDILYRLGYATGTSGETESGLAMIEQAIELSEENDLAAISIPAHMLLALLYLHMGEKEKARQQALYANREGQLRSFYTAPLSSGLILGNLALADGDSAAARQYAQAMLAQTKQPANIFIEIEGLLLLLRTLHHAQQEEAVITQRLYARLDEMETYARHPDLAPLFQNYRKNLLTAAL